MAKIISTKEELMKGKPHERTQIKNFNEFEEILDYLFALKVKPQKVTIWRWFDKWCLSINYNEK